jgi:hypothetical protein
MAKIKVEVYIVICVLERYFSLDYSYKSANKKRITSQPIAPQVAQVAALQKLIVHARCCQSNSGDFWEIKNALFTNIVEYIFCSAHWCDAGRMYSNGARDAGAI